MNLVIVIALDLLAKKLSGIRNIFDSLTKTTSDQTVLEPPVGPFNFTLGLRREDIGDLNA